MDDNKKIEIFDKCFNKETVDFLDKLTDVELSNLCSNVSGLLDANNGMVKRQIKKMTQKPRR